MLCAKPKAYGQGGETKLDSKCSALTLEQGLSTQMTSPAGINIHAGIRWDKQTDTNSLCVLISAAWNIESTYIHTSFKWLKGSGKAVYANVLCVCVFYIDSATYLKMQIS